MAWLMHIAERLESSQTISLLFFKLQTSMLYMFALTALEPLRKESRFRQTGSRISMQLKFRQAAGALANGSAAWKVQEREWGKTSSHLRRKLLKSQEFTFRAEWDPLFSSGPRLPPQRFTMNIFKHKENLKWFHHEYLLAQLPDSTITYLSIHLPIPLSSHQHILLLMHFRVCCRHHFTFPYVLKHVYH